MLSRCNVRIFKVRLSPFTKGHHNMYECNGILLIHTVYSTLRQRILNELWRARLSRSRMIWLLAHPLLPSPVSNLDRRPQEDWERETTCWRETSGGGGGRGVEPNERQKAWSSRNNWILSAVHAFMHDTAVCKGPHKCQVHEFISIMKWQAIFLSFVLIMVHFINEPTAKQLYYFIYCTIRTDRAVCIYLSNLYEWFQTENIEWFIEDQPFDMAPRPSPSSPLQSVNISFSVPVCRRSS